MSHRSSAGGCPANCACHKCKPFELCFTLGRTNHIPIPCPHDPERPGCSMDDPKQLTDSVLIFYCPCCGDEIWRCENVVKIGRCDCSIKLDAKNVPDKLKNMKCASDFELYVNGELALSGKGCIQ